MTVPATGSRAGPFSGTGVVVPLPFDFKVFVQEDVLVTRTDVNGLESTLVVGVDYTVTLNPDQDADPGGVVVPVVAPAVGELTTLTSGLEYEQPIDLVTGGKFRAQTVEDGFDRTTMLIKQLKEQGDRTLHLPVSAVADVTLPVPEANALIGWNQDADALQNVDPTTLATIVAFGTTQADLFSGDGAQTAFTLTANPGVQANLDVAVGGVTQRPGVDYTWSAGTTLTFVVAPPAGTNNILARYQQGLPAPDTAIRQELATTADASKGDALIGVKQPLAGAVGRTQHEKNSDANSVLDMGSGSTGLAPAVALGGSAFSIPAGTYTYTAPLAFDYSSVSFPDYMSPSRRASLNGDALHSSFLRYNGAASSYSIVFIGPAVMTTGGIFSQSLLQDFALEDSGHTRTRNGLAVTNTAFCEFRRLNISFFNVGTYLNSSLSHKFDNVTWTYNNIGCVIDSTTLQALPNAISWDNCEWNANVTAAVTANVIGSTNAFRSCRIEQNGTTSGAAGQGGLILSINPSNGPAALNFDSCYFEGNGGVADLFITNTGAENATVVIKGCTFNRTSSAKYVTQNIVGANSGAGTLRIVLIGCSFFSTGTYVPNAARPFFTAADTHVQFIDGGGNTFSETTSDVTGMAGSPGVSANFDSAGGTVSAPSGVTCVRTGAGAYTISSVVPFGKDAASYAVQIAAHAPFGAAANYQRVSATSFTVQMRNPSTLVQADTDFSISVFRIK